MKDIKMKFLNADQCKTILKVLKSCKTRAQFDTWERWILRLKIEDRHRKMMFISANIFLSEKFGIKRIQLRGVDAEV